MKQVTSLFMGALISTVPMSILTTSVALASDAVGENTVIVALGGGQITPYSLVSQGYQGFFKSEGIPSAGRFIAGVRTNRITASSLIEVGVRMGRLPESSLNDDSYRRAVTTVLENTINTN